MPAKIGWDMNNSAVQRYNDPGRDSFRGRGGGVNGSTFYGKNQFSYGNKQLERSKYNNRHFNNSMNGGPVTPRNFSPYGNGYRDFNRNSHRNANTTPPNFRHRKWNGSPHHRNFKSSFSSSPHKRNYGRSPMSESRITSSNRGRSPPFTPKHHNVGNYHSSPSPYSPTKSPGRYSSVENRSSCHSRKRLLSEMESVTPTKSSDAECTPEKLFSPSPRQNGSSTAFRSSPGNYENKRNPFRKKKLIDDVDRDRVIAAYAPDSENVHNKENLVVDRTAQLPHLIGFPNQGNTCYLNATLQALFGLPPFTSELSDVFNKVAANTVCKNVSVLFNARSRGNKQYMNIALKRVKNSLGTIHEAFNGARMQDAQEFLTHLLDSVKDDIDRVEQKTDQNEESNENRRSENLSESPRKPLAEIPSTLHTATSIEINPVTENFQLRIQESIHCTKCQESHTTTQDHISLFLNVPHKRISDDSSEEYRPSLQDALNLYLRPDNREMHCTKCGNQDHKVTTTLTQLPRILVLQLKRYNYASQSVKLQDLVKLPQYLNVNNFLNEEVERPHRWCPTPESQSDEEPDDSTDFKTSELGSSIDGQEENPIVLDDEDRELQEALRISREEHAKREMDEETALEEAIKLSLAEQAADTGDWDDTHDSSGIVEDDCIDAGSLPYSYRLISIVSHRGKNANTGHYVTDVYKLDENEWYHYDDESVTKVAEQDVLGQARQRNGYIFFYMFKDTCEQLASESPKS